MYNILVKHEDGWSEVLFTTNDLDEAKTKIAFFVQAYRTPGLLVSSPVYESMRLEKSELICEFDMGEPQ